MNPLALDPHLLGRVRDLHVERAMHEVQLPDHSLQRFHFVLVTGVRDRFLRALRLCDGVTFAIFDLRKLASVLAVEIPGYLDRDVPGLVKYTLRPLYPNAVALLTAVVAEAVMLGIPELL